MKAAVTPSPQNTGLAVYAAQAQNSRGRLITEAEASNRTVFQRDRDRIIHCSAFRKLEYKTQVFVNHEGDYYRTRLTHSLEVSQIARSIARNLQINEDLTEALALAHDLGHPPFGHAAEDALDELMADYGGFNHNIQALRILTHLEQRYAAFNGLNLTWETLEGVVKHNGPIENPTDKTLTAYLKQHDLEVTTYASLEAQVAAISDDIAYHNHDIDDGIRAGLLDVDELVTVELIGPVFKDVIDQYPDVTTAQVIHESTRRIINMMVRDVLETTSKNLAELQPSSIDDVRRAGKVMVEFSKKMAEQNQALKKFLMRNVYRHYKVNRMNSKAKRVVSELFNLFMAEPECLPTDWHQARKAMDEADAAQVVVDYIAGMTDRYAMEEHRKLFDMYQKND